MAGFGLVRSYTSVGGRGAGTQAIDFKDVADNIIHLYGNYNDVYTMIYESTDSTLKLAPPPPIATIEHHQRLPSWNTAEAFSQGKNVFLAASRRLPAGEGFGPVEVWTISGKNGSEELQISLSAEGSTGLGRALFTDDAWIDTTAFAIGCEIIKRTVEAPKFVEGVPNTSFSLKMTADPEQSPIPVIDNVIDVSYFNIDRVQESMGDSMLNSSVMPPSWQDTTLMMQLTTRSGREFLFAASDVQFDETGFDVDGDPSNGRALVRKVTLLLPLPNDVMIPKFLKNHYIDYRYGRVQLFCARQTDPYYDEKCIRK
jgi:hypothetical protein